MQISRLHTKILILHVWQGLGISNPLGPAGIPVQAVTRSRWVGHKNHDIMKIIMSLFKDCREH